MFRKVLQNPEAKVKLKIFYKTLKLIIIYFTHICKCLLLSPLFETLQTKRKEASKFISLQRYSYFSFYMENLDLIKVNFSPDQLFLLNICLAFIVFGIALDMRVSDFKYLVKNPKAAIVGLVSQLVLLPILTILLIYAFSPPTSLALGMLLIGVCPGGTTSNFMVHLAKANTALSLTLTSVVTIGAIAITPVVFSLLTPLIPGTEDLQTNIYVSPKDMVLTITQLIILPLIVGMSLNHYFEKATDAIRKPVRLISLVLFFGFVIFAVKGNWDNIVNYLGGIFIIVLVYNTLALAMGYYWSRLNGLNKYDAQAISIETGIQNSGLALILIFNFFDGLGGMAMVAAWWGVWHLISGFGIAMWWSRTNKLAKGAE